MTQATPTFKDQVYELVAHIPRGKVMTYGQIAYLCGRPRAALLAEGVKIDKNYRVDMEAHLWRPESEVV